MSFYKKAPMSNSTFMKKMLENKEKENQNNILEQQEINLYQKGYVSESKQYVLDRYNKEMIKNNSLLQKSNLKDAILEELVTTVLYDGILAPVLEMSFANSHQHQLGYNIANNFVKEHGANKLLKEWKNSNYYMQSMQEDVSNWYNYLIESAEEKVKEGLSLKDAYQIEQDNINDFIITIKDNIPKDIDETINERVADSIQDFIDDNKKNKADMEKIYMDAKSKMVSDNDIGIQQEASMMAKRKENKILNRPTNVFGEMTKIMLESVHKISVLKESYSNNNKLDFKKIMKDTEVMYTFLECLNTLSIVNVNESYITNMLLEMKNSVNLTKENVEKQLKNSY